MGNTLKESMEGVMPVPFAAATTRQAKRSAPLMTQGLSNVPMATITLMVKIMVRVSKPKRLRPWMIAVNFVR